jgi:predicted metal-dependent hydrolase
MSFHNLNFGSRVINFTLLYAERKTLAISVYPDLSVIVTAPADAKLDQVTAKVKRRAPWILKQQLKFSEFLPQQPERRFVSGETHLYLGRQYRLKLIESETECVKLKGRFLIVQTPDKTDTSGIKHLVEKWYFERARSYFKQKITTLIDLFRKFDLPPPGIRLRRMTKRWGTCGKDGTINLNPDLIRASSSSVEYVIIHELCHLIYPNHNRAFYMLLRRILPDWEKRKARLESQG